MYTYEQIYNTYIESGTVRSEDILKLMQYLCKEKKYKFFVRYCGYMPLTNIEGYTVDIKDSDAVLISASTAALQTSILSALSKLRTMLL